MLARAAAVLVASLMLCCAAPAQSRGSDSRSTTSPREAQEVRIYDVSDLPADADMGAFAALMSIQLKKLTPTLVVVSAPADQQEQFRAALEQIRTLTPESVVVSATLHRVKDASALRVGQPAGDAMQASSAARRVELTGARRTELAMNSTESTTFIEDVTPVVGNNAAAFDPTIGNASSGLSLSVRVGDSVEGRSPVSVTGSFTQAILDARKTPMLEASLTVGVDSMDRATTTMRSLGGSLTLAANQPTIAAIVDDPEAPGGSLVLVLSIAPAP